MVQSMVGCRSNVTSYAIGVHFFAQLAPSNVSLRDDRFHSESPPYEKARDTDD